MRNARTYLYLAVLLAGTSCVKTYSTATDTSKPPSQSSQSLLDYLKNNYAFSMFYGAIQRVGLDRAITDSGKFTLLVPDNDAFGRAGITPDSLQHMDTAALRWWLGFHIVQGAIGYDSVPQTIDNIYYSILGQAIFFSRPLPTRGGSTTPTLHIDGVAVNNFDIAASNGFIQVLNTPLNAPLKGTLQDYIDANLDQYSLFKQALQHFGLWDELLTDTGRQMTVFAPVNGDFANIPILVGEQTVYYTITPDTIAAWDTTVIPKAIWEVYFYPGRIFTTDFSDAPPNGNTINGSQPASYILPDLSAAIFLSIYSQPSLSASLLTPYESRLKGGSIANVLLPGNYVTTSGNNVLQPVDHIMLIP